MSRLVTNGGTSGQLGWPYDSRTQNAYRLDMEDAGIQQYHITLAITGDDEDEVSAQVSVWEDGNEKVLATRDAASINAGDSLAMEDGDSFQMQGDLPRALRVEKSGIGCGTFTFTYGEATDGLRVFRFESDNKGYGAWSHTPKGVSSGRYCVPEGIEGKDSKGATIVIGTRLRCSFPGW